MIADKNEVITLAQTLKDFSARLLDDELKYVDSEEARQEASDRHAKFVKSANFFICQSIKLKERIETLNEKQKSK